MSTVAGQFVRLSSVRACSTVHSSPTHGSPAHSSFVSSRVQPLKCCTVAEVRASSADCCVPDFTSTA